MNRGLAAWILAVGLTACMSELAVPEHAQVGCRTDADCPSGWICNVAAGQGAKCVEVAKRDQDPPGLEANPPPERALTLDRDLLAPGTTATLAFSVNESLLVPPEVTFTANRLRPFQLDEANTDREKRRYQLTYSTTGDEPEGERFPLTIVLVDEAGNRSEVSAGRAIAFDRTAPRTLALELKGAPLRKGATATLSFTASEDLAKEPAPVVRLEGGRTLTRNSRSSGRDFVYTYTAVGDEVKVPRDLKVEIELVDLAGNRGQAQPSPRIAFDFVNPALASAVTAPRAAAKLGTEVTVTLVTTERLAPESEVKLGSIALSRVSEAEGPSSTTTRFKHVAAIGEEGSHPLSVKLIDPAGNVHSETLPGVVFDFTPPTLTAKDLHPSQVGASETFELRLKTSESLPGHPKATFHNGIDPAAPMKPVLLPAPTGLDFLFQGRSLATGGGLLYPITVTLEDAAGNQATKTAATLAVDNVKPQLIGRLSIAPRLAKRGDVIKVELSATEPLSGPPTLRANGPTPIVFAPDSKAAGRWSYSYSFEVKGGDGVYALAPFILEDQLLNQTPVVPLETLEIDVTPPSMGEPAIKPAGTMFSAQAGHRLVTVILDGEDVGADVTGVIDGRGMECGPYQPAAPNYTCTYEVQGDERSGKKSLVISARDKAGNVTTKNAQVELDSRAARTITS